MCDSIPDWIGIGAGLDYSVFADLRLVDIAAVIVIILLRQKCLEPFHILCCRNLIKVKMV
jgi:hypothetical protein